MTWARSMHQYWGGQHGVKENINGPKTGSQPTAMKAKEADSAEANVSSTDACPSGQPANLLHDSYKVHSSAFPFYPIPLAALDPEIVSPRQSRYQAGRFQEGTAIDGSA